MDRQNFIQDFQQKLIELFRASPAADLERNIKALMGQTFSRLDLVTREEFDVQVELLRALRQRVQALEDRAGPSGTSPRSWSETGPDVVPGASAGSPSSPSSTGTAGASSATSSGVGSIGAGTSGSGGSSSGGMGGTGRET